MDFFIALVTHPVFWSAVSAIGTAAALIYLAQQNISMKKSLHFDTQWRKKEKAVELAAFYSKDVIPRINYCMSVFRVCGIDKQLVSIDPRKMIRFTHSELYSLYGTHADIRKEVDYCINKIDSEVFETFRNVLPIQFKKQTDFALDKIDRRTFLISEFHEISTSLLNDLEYFSMCINCGIVDGDIVYQSLHQTFFNTVQIFYYQIASLNVNAKDKYFTHTIKLFETWNSKYKDKANEERNFEDDLCNEYSSI